MLPRIQELVEKLQLLPHPEGGFYSETYRSAIEVETDHGQRSLITCIYFLLTSENQSKFHQIKSDEMWYFHEGSPLTVHILDEKGYDALLVGPVSDLGHLPQQLVPAGVIFGSSVDEPNSYSLVSCVVSPGFDFDDFRLCTAEELISRWPDEKDIIKKLT